MASDWLILHGGALGDLVLTIQLALRLPGVDEHGLHVVSRVNPGDLSMCRPRIVRQSSETLGLHWLFSDSDQPPAVLRDQVRGRRVLSALGSPHTIVHQRLLELKPAALFSFDPRPRDGVERHITEQWQTQLEAQGLLVPKCIHQQPTHRSLGVPVSLRARGRELLAASFDAPRPGPQSPVPNPQPPAPNPGPRTRHVLFHPGSGGRRKCWPLERFIALAREMRRHPRADVAFLLGAVELETWPSGEMDTIAGELSLHSAPSADNLAALLAGADVFAGNDAGPTHLAALLGTATVAVFGPTSPTVWQPLGRAVAVVRGTSKHGPADAWPAAEVVAGAVGELL